MTAMVPTVSRGGYWRYISVDLYLPAQERIAARPSFKDGDSVSRGTFRLSYNVLLRGSVACIPCHAIQRSLPSPCQRINVHMMGALVRSPDLLVRQ